MTVVPGDIGLKPGCDARCELFRYRALDSRNRGICVVRAHSWEAHNDYAHERRGGRRVFSWNGLYVDLDEHAVIVDGRRLDIESGRCPTIREWGLLRTLVRNAGMLVSHDHLLTTNWGNAYQGDHHLLRVCVARLRRKLDPKASTRFIETLPGLGYRMGRFVPENVEELAPTVFDCARVAVLA